MIFYQSEKVGSAVGTSIVGGHTQTLTAIIEFVWSFCTCDTKPLLSRPLHPLRPWAARIPVSQQGKLSLRIFFIFHLKIVALLEIGITWAAERSGRWLRHFLPVVMEHQVLNGDGTNTTVHLHTWVWCKFPLRLSCSLDYLSSEPQTDRKIALRCQI